MNLLIVRQEEVGPEGVIRLDDRRAGHIRSVLHGTPGQMVRLGLLNGPKGQGVILSIDRQSVTLCASFDATPPPEERIDILIALPRPKVLKRLYAPLASMGVRSVVLTNASKVERKYFDTHWLEPEHYEPLLIEGLEQAGDTRLPRVRIVKRLKPYLEDELAPELPNWLPLLAHPAPTVQLGTLTSRPDRRTLLAVGPEGGWTDFELKLFDGLGFQRISLGPRILRTDIACVALLAVLNVVGPDVKLAAPEFAGVGFQEMPTAPTPKPET